MAFDADVVSALEADVDDVGEDRGGGGAEQAERGEAARGMPGAVVDLVDQAGQEEGRQHGQGEGPGEPGQPLGQRCAAGGGGGHCAAVDRDLDDQRAEQHDADADGEEAAAQEGSGEEAAQGDARLKARSGGRIERGGGHGVSQWRAYSSAR